MKGRMDVLNFKKGTPSKSKSQVRSYRNESSSCPYTVVKLEPDDEREKENCGDMSDCSDLVIDTNKEMSDEEEAEIGEENVIADLPVLSVIIKEEEGVLDYSDDIPMSKPRSEVDMKYEDDIEEEDYDSEDSEAMGSGEMHEFTLQDYEKSNSTSSSIQMNTQIMQRNQTENSTSSCINPYFESSILNFQMGSHFGEKFSNNGASENDDPFNKEKSSDSVLLSIVYATINVPFSQVSKFLTAYNLSKSQLSVIRKVRRQVKNRLYAQNCRRRRVAHIKNLANELKQLKNEKEKLCSIRDELTARKATLETRYKLLYDYIINVLRERHKQSEFRSTECDEDFSDEEEMLEAHTEKLLEERRAMEEKKRKLETEYGALHEHVFKVISTRNHNNGMARNGIDNSLDFQLCNMNIVNELALLNQYWTKNNAIAGETMDFESSISVDGSRTSENKLNDFVDSESSISVDGSRTEENTINYDLIDYDSGTEEVAPIRQNGDSQSKSDPDPNPVATDDESNIENIRAGEESYGRMSEESVMAWSDNSDHDENSDDEDEDCMDKEELELLKMDLKEQKMKIEEQYIKLYNYVLKATEMNEIDFLKAFMDHCIKLLNVPKRDPCSVAFDIS